MPMKKHRIFYTVLTLLFIAWSCKQEAIEPQDPTPPPPPPPVTAGSANFAKFVAIGSSFTAGFQAGALFDDGQANSLPAIMAGQFAVPGGGGGVFKQPGIKATLGYNIFVTPNPGTDNRVLGRFLLQGADPVPTAQKYALGDLTAVTNPRLNSGILSTGSKKKMNKFAVEGIKIGKILYSPQGNWGQPNTAVGFTPFFCRFSFNTEAT